MEQAVRHLGAIVDEVSVEGPAPEGRTVRLNLAFTHEGLRALGLGDEPLGRFPMEFRQGMEARCSVLGDLRANHPRRWRLPLRNWGTDTANHGITVEMAAARPNCWPESWNAMRQV